MKIEFIDENNNDISDLRGFDCTEQTALLFMNADTFSWKNIN